MVNQRSNQVFILVSQIQKVQRRFAFCCFLLIVLAFIFICVYEKEKRGRTIACGTGNQDYMFTNPALYYWMSLPGLLSEDFKWPNRLLVFFSHNSSITSLKECRFTEPLLSQKVISTFPQHRCHLLMFLTHLTLPCFTLEVIQIWRLIS